MGDSEKCNISIFGSLINLAFDVNADCASTLVQQGKLRSVGKIVSYSWTLDNENPLMFTYDKKAWPFPSVVFRLLRGHLSNQLLHPSHLHVERCEQGEPAVKSHLNVRQ